MARPSDRRAPGSLPEKCRQGLMDMRKRVSAEDRKTLDWALAHNDREQGPLREANGKSQADARERHAGWRREADKLRKKFPWLSQRELARRVAEQEGVGFEAVRNALKKNRG